MQKMQRNLKVLTRAKKGKVDQQRAFHQANSKLVQHHRSIVCTIGSFGDEYGIQHGGISEI
jgi:hypothetical protein